MSTSHTTTDHDSIKKWIEACGGHPSRVKGRGEGGILRIDFNEPEESLKKISWDEFFEIFDGNDLAFLSQDETGSGSIRTRRKQQHQNKFVSRQ